MLILAFFALGGFGPTASPGLAEELAPPEGARRLDPDYAVWVDPVDDRVLFDGVVVRDKGILEFFACLTETREHEAIVAVDAPAFLIHTALLASGAEPGSTVRYRPEYRPPSGERIEITVEWLAEGQKKTARIQDWIRRRDTAAAMTEEFVFTGSGFYNNPNTGEQQYLAEGGELICVANFSEAMIDVAAPSTKFGDPSSPFSEDLWYEPYTTRIPPVGTPVRIVLKPTGKTLSGADALAPTTTPEEFLILVKAIPVGTGSTEKLRQSRQSIPAWPTSAILTLLAGMDDASPNAENWTRLAIDTVAQAAEPTDLPVAELKAFLADASHSGRARRTAWELIRAADAAAADTLLDDLVDDASSELRHEAVNKLLDRAEAADSADREPLLRRALGAARTLAQMERTEKALEKIDIEIVLADELGLVREWLVAGPFDNREGVGFAAEYPPETKLDAAATYNGHDAEGPQGPFGWKPAKTGDRLGVMPLHERIGPHKGAAGYAWVTVMSDREQPVEVRHSSYCATRVWLGGKRVASDELYHSGSPFDQRVATAALAKGENQLLIKVCQNEQTQPWAQVWPFSLRLTGPAGAPLKGVTTQLPEVP